MRSDPIRRTARPALALAALLLALAGLAQPARAGATVPVVGFGEQDPSIFSDPRWQRMGTPYVRLVVGWDALHFDWQRAELDGYIARADAAGAKVLLGFSHSREAGRENILPSVRRYRAEFLAFRRRYPTVREFITWNEANHGSQPTFRRPGTTARYYMAARAACPGCTILAASVLDGTKMPAWVRAFERVATGPPPIWGLHNYIDANRFRTRGTRSLLRATRGQVWLTETGGIVRRAAGAKLRLAQGVRHAQRAMRWLFTRLVPLSSRIRRVYIYEWRPSLSPTATWDSAIMDPHGRPRLAFSIVDRAVRRSNAARRRSAVTPAGGAPGPSPSAPAGQP